MELWIASAACILLLGIGAWIILSFFRIALRGGMSEYEKRRDKQRYPDRQTPLGTMSYDVEQWTMLRDFGHGQLRVCADDIAGEPDPKLVAYLVAHWGDLQKMADAARKRISDIEPHHEFDRVCSTRQGDVCLGFSYDEAYSGETVYVDMSGLNVLGWVTVD